MQNKIEYTNQTRYIHTDPSDNDHISDEQLHLLFNRSYVVVSEYLWCFHYSRWKLKLFFVPSYFSKEVHVHHQKTRMQNWAFKIMASDQHLWKSVSIRVYLDKSDHTQCVLRSYKNEYALK